MCRGMPNRPCAAFMSPPVCSSGRAVHLELAFALQVAADGARRRLLPRLRRRRRQTLQRRRGPGPGAHSWPCAGLDTTQTCAALATTRTSSSLSPCRLLPTAPDAVCRRLCDADADRRRGAVGVQLLARESRRVPVAPTAAAAAAVIEATEIALPTLPASLPGVRLRRGGAKQGVEAAWPLQASPSVWRLLQLLPLPLPMQGGQATGAAGCAPAARRVGAGTEQRLGCIAPASSAGARPLPPVRSHHQGSGGCCAANAASIAAGRTLASRGTAGR